VKSGESGEPELFEEGDLWFYGGYEWGDEVQEFEGEFEEGFGDGNASTARVGVGALAKFCGEPVETGVDANQSRGASLLDAAIEPLAVVIHPDHPEGVARRLER
jgi:hypothetical protein